MTMKKAVCALLGFGFALPALAQTTDAETGKRAYIDSAFGRMDTDGNGQIDRSEFERFMEARFAQRKAQFDAEFGEIDKNGDGKLDKAEALAGNPILGARFEAIDGNADGFVTPDEIRSAILNSQRHELPES